MKTPEPGTFWKHYKRGDIYQVLLLANKESTTQDRYPTTVVYMGTNGNVWSRPLHDWHRSMTFWKIKLDG